MDIEKQLSLHPCHSLYSHPRYSPCSTQVLHWIWDWLFPGRWWWGVWMCCLLPSVFATHYCCREDFYFWSLGIEVWLDWKSKLCIYSLIFSTHLLLPGLLLWIFDVYWHFLSSSKVQTVTWPITSMLWDLGKGWAVSIWLKQFTLWVSSW